MKRVLDIFAAGVALLALSPVLLLLIVVIRLKLGRPVFFVQQRPGLGGRPFNLVKFRTMTGARDAQGRLLPDAQRLTPFGLFLRRSSLDELPELWNVLKGDMSLVGPRPLLMDYLPLYDPEQARRHEVRPGLTGWAQIHGRNDTTWEERLARDVWYVDHRSLWLDLRIMLRTAGAVLFQRGIQARGHVSMPRFEGSKQENPPRAT